MPVHNTPSSAAAAQERRLTSCAGQCASANGRVSSAAQDKVAAATAAGGMPVRYLRTRLAPTPYRKAAAVPAATAQPRLAPALLLPASTTTPANPVTSATPRRALMCS